VAAQTQTTRRPQTRASLTRDLAGLGVASGDTLVVHSSLKSLGWVCGAEQTAVHALLDAVGRTGTVVVPTQTMDNTDPSGWRNPPVPEDWWPTIRAQTPAFDPRITPSARMGRIAEAVRTWPGAVRSPHPQTSFAAVGARAGELMDHHPLDCRLGEDSPLARLERADARILLLGTGFDTCTALHLAEYRVPRPTTEESSCAVLTADGDRTWTTFTDVAPDSHDFPRLGSDLEARGGVVRGRVGEAAARLFSLPDAVAFATSWLTGHRAR